jgi:hypothetical protein
MEGRAIMACRMSLNLAGITNRFMRMDTSKGNGIISHMTITIKTQYLIQWRLQHELITTNTQ